MPRRITWEGVALLLVLAGGLLASSCSDDSAPRSVVTIESINANESLDSDVYNNGDDGEPGTSDDLIYEDQVPIVLRNRPHDSALDLTSAGAFGAVVFDHYEVTFQGEEALPTVSGAMYLKVAAGATVTGEVTIVPVAYKIVPPLSTLRQGGEILLNSQITLYGEEQDSGQEVVAKGVLPVHCANWGDE